MAYSPLPPPQTDYSAQNQAGLAARQAQLAQRAAAEQQRQAGMTAANQAAAQAPAAPVGAGIVGNNGPAGGAQNQVLGARLTLANMMREYLNAPSAATLSAVRNAQQAENQAITQNPDTVRQMLLNPDMRARLNPSMAGAVTPESMARVQAFEKEMMQAAQGGPAAPALANANPNAAFNRPSSPWTPGGTNPLEAVRAAVQGSWTPEQRAQWGRRQPGGSPGFGDDTGGGYPRGPMAPGAQFPGAPVPAGLPPRGSSTFGANKNPPSAPPGAPNAGSPERNAYLNRQALAQRLAASRTPTG